MPRYSSTWDVDIVTTYIASMGRNEVSLKRLSQKLVVLIALVEASRTSELALDIRFRTYKPDGVAFKLVFLTKKRTPGLPPKELFFGAFPGDNSLCVVHCLRQYERVLTQEFRSTEIEAKPLFVSYTRPHKPVMSQRLAHWIKDLLSGQGLQGTLSAWSIGINRGVSLSDILSTADWSKESTFRRFYYRESKTADYVAKVLQGDKSAENW